VALWIVTGLFLFFAVLVGIAVQSGHQFHSSGIGGLRRFLAQMRRFRGIKESGGMCGRVDLLQRADRHVRVNLRGLDVLVSEHLLDIADVRAAFEHVRRHRVPHQMTRAYLADIRGHEVKAHCPRQMVAAERFALGRQKHGHVVRLDGKLGPRFVNVLFYPRRFRSMTVRPIVKQKRHTDVHFRGTKTRAYGMKIFLPQIKCGVDYNDAPFA
jgi:hypothetical protein